MGAFDDLVPQAKSSGAFADLVPSAAATADASTGGGVQDWEPSYGETRGQVMARELPRDKFAEWITTRARNVATGMAGIPRTLSDLQGAALQWAGMTPEEARQAKSLNLVTSAGEHMPSSEQMNAGVRQWLPEVNTPGRGGQILDVAVEAGLGATVFPGAARNLLPAIVGGGTSEVAGQAAQGSKWEPVVRFAGAVLPGAATAGAQNVMGSVARGVKNVTPGTVKDAAGRVRGALVDEPVVPSAEQSAARVIGRNLTRDKMTMDELAEAQAALGPGAMPVEAAGPNVTGSFRGSTAAPGQARTTAQTRFDERLAGTDERTTAALDKHISKNNSLASSTDELDALRRQKAAPLYEEAGIPERPELRQRAIDEPPTWNSPTVSTPRIDALLRDSDDVRAAIASARRLPAFKDVPDNSMIMLDKAYKHLGGLEQEAMRSGNAVRARDLSNLRRDFQAAIAEGNPRYERALAAYSGPSRLIDASERAKEWFTKNVDPKIVEREWGAMSSGDREAARIGIRDWARTVADRSDRGIAAERVWSGPGHRRRLEATVGFNQLKQELSTERNLIAKQRETGVGSRTVPLANEQADNALENATIMADLLRGRLGSAGAKIAGRAFDRISEGKSEATNALIADWLTSTDPAKVGLVKALAEQARLQELAKSQGRMNALLYGGVTVPGQNALVASGHTR